ncbi:uncharacterized protein TRIADDRAFT_51770 [Trichoplax adhaerens]|uniref:Neurotrypsin n=1 Tax=Trichoplax adhaerens TaxID=10228 RepID=B3RKU5_TRIAD|nr:hypothetical protein TRIADDRAFT_51770 [Trichoplax adhaerens]EDV28647.1 hypothetical protein TRIADDRAFT_51770 [Trichoplax adhaerens]|eukprot:XP_002107849.1 hypothetical protein TRIADDRAFT_51770 [Trichoplax adhaerens]
MTYAGGHKYQALTPLIGLGVPVQHQVLGLDRNLITHLKTIYDKQLQTVYGILYILSLSGSGHYLYIEASAPRTKGDFADLLSPPLYTPRNVYTVNVRFDYNMHGDGIGSLEVYVIYAKYNFTEKLLNVKQGNQGSHWLTHHLQFHPQYNEYHIFFRGIIGDNYKSDIAIDDIAVYVQEINCVTGNGRFFRGTNSFTKSGLTCLAWNSLARFNPRLYPMDDLKRNYCRNPGGLRSRPWCYVTSGSSNGSWEYCGVTQCLPSSIKQLSGYPGGHRIPVKLVGGQANYGRVVVYQYGQWGTVCNQNFGTASATTICRQLGLPTPGYRLKHSISSGSGRIWIERLDCFSYSKDLSECTISWNSSYCIHQEDVGVRCGPLNDNKSISTVTPINKAPISVELLGGSSNEGIVVVNLNGSKGIICDLDWNIKTADVVCRTLGFVGAKRSYGKYFPKRTWRTLLTSISCNGYESSFRQCGYSIQPGVNSCNTKVAASVTCETDSSDAAMKCDFSNGFCQWKNLITNDLKWLWHKNGYHFSPIFSNNDMSFIYLTLAMQKTKSDGRATLLSPRLRKSSTVQMFFKYLNTGSGVKKLIIEYLDDNAFTHNINTIQLGSFQNDVWIQRAFSFYPPGKSFQIRIVAVYDTADNTNGGAILIEKINLSGCSPYTRKSITIVALITIAGSVGLVLTIVVAFIRIRRRYSSARNRSTNIPAGLYDRIHQSLATSNSNASLPAYCPTTPIGHQSFAVHDQPTIIQGQQIRILELSYGCQKITSGKS